MATPLSLDQKARALGFTIVAIWATWDNATASEDDKDNALRLACEAAIALDMTRVGTMSSSLKYFAIAYLEEHNPEDLTYSEMIGSIEVALTL